MRKIILIMSLIALSSFASPNSYANQQNAMQNVDKSFSPYVGLSLGWQSYSSNEKTLWSGQASGATSYQFGNDRFSPIFSFGFTRNIFDYGSLGAEVFYNGNAIHYKQMSSGYSSADNYIFSHTLKNTWGVQLIPGFYLNRLSMIYLPIGWAQSKIDLSTTAPKNVPSYSKTINGLRLGLGIEQAISDQLHLKLEYINTRYQNFTTHFITDNQQKDRRYSLRTNQFNLGLTYYFDAIKSKGYFKPVKLTDGWYLGAGLGGSSQTTKSTFFDATDSSKQTQIFYGNSLLANLLIGYGYKFDNHWYLGTELSAILENNRHQQTSTVNEPALSRTATMKDSYQVSILPGYQFLNNFRLYLRAGLSKGHYIYTTQQDIETKTSKTLNGISIGFGGELALTEQWALRAEYQQINYGSLQDTLGPSTEKVKPTMHYYLLSAIYRFG